MAFPALLVDPIARAAEKLLVVVDKAWYTRQEREEDALEREAIEGRKDGLLMAVEIERLRTEARIAESQSRAIAAQGFLQQFLFALATAGMGALFWFDPEKVSLEVWALYGVVAGAGIPNLPFLRWVQSLRKPAKS